MKIKFPHIHRIQNKMRSANGIWWLMECRCGARRVKRRVFNWYGPVGIGWPRPRAPHYEDSGWESGTLPGS